MWPLNFQRTGVLFVLAVFAAGCATPPPAPKSRPSAAPQQPRSSAAPAPAPARPLPPPGPARKFAPARPLSPGVAALLKNADADLAAGRLASAAAALERAQRLAPRSPEVWQRLAKVKLRQQEWEQAVQAATRSNMLAPGDLRMQARNWDIIAQARAAAGDAPAAQQARAKSIELQNKAK